MWQQRVNVWMDKKQHLRASLCEHDCKELAGNLCRGFNSLLSQSCSMVLKMLTKVSYH